MQKVNKPVTAQHVHVKQPLFSIATETYNDLKDTSILIASVKANVVRKINLGTVQGKEIITIYTTGNDKGFTMTPDTKMNVDRKDGQVSLYTDPNQVLEYINALNDKACQELDELEAFIAEKRALIADNAILVARALSTTSTTE